MDELDDLLSCLQTHVQPVVRGLFKGLQTGPLPMLGSRTVVAGNVTSYGDDWVDLMAMWFVPGTGFLPPREERITRVHIHDILHKNLHLCQGVQIMCIGEKKPGSDDHDVTLTDANICFRPEFDPALPWDCFHMFCGGFCGWSQALRWMDRAQEIYLGQEIFLDADPQIMSIWSVKHGTQYRTLPLAGNEAWCPAKQVGLCGCISEPCVADACRTQANLIATMSPPCQSWSKGGRGCGLNDLNGKAFLDALIQAFSLQTIAIAAECADDIAVHPHFKVIKALAKAMGFRLAWDQITPYHQMTSHSRSRWLGVWVRSDAALQLFPFQLKLPCMPQMHWTDQACQFPTPQRWNSQLSLTPSECQIYDSPMFLPPAKRPRYENRDLKTNEIIRSRVPTSADILPTLCASYTRQHQLAEHHLRQKGIFACLRETATGFQFLEPTLFCSLFGAIEHVVLSEKVGESFRIVGNAISIPHSLLALSITFHCTSTCKADPIGLVRQAWKARLTAYNAVVFHHEGFIHLIPKCDFWNWISLRAPPLEPGNWTLNGLCEGRNICFNVHSNQTVQQVFRDHCSGPDEILEQIHARNEDIRVCTKTTIEQIACQESTFRLAIGNTNLGLLEIRTASCTKVISEPPSDECPCVVHIENKNFDDHIGSNIFWAVQHVVETLQDDSQPKSCAATVVVLPEQLTITAHLSEASGMQFLQQIAGLQIFRDRNKQICCIPDEIDNFLLLSAARDCEEPSKIEVIVRADWQRTCGASIPTDATTIRFHCDLQVQHAIERVNGVTSNEPHHHFQFGDVIDICASRPVHAGGHHLNTAAPPTLPAFADFTARVEFMCDTHGWVATDEMFHYTQALQWQQDWLRFGTPQLWNVANGDFEPPIFGELNIPNNSTTAFPVLIGSHWAGIEVTRQGTDTSVTFIHVSEQHQTQLTFLVARLLDIAPHRFQVRCERNDPPPHLCGWFLIFRWYRRHGLHQGIADISHHFQLNVEYNQLIQLAMQCSNEDWAISQIPIEIGQLAHTLRKNFLRFLARRELQGRPHQQIALATGCPPPQQQPPAAQAQPDIPVAPLPWLDRSQAILDRIQDRLNQILLHPGWLSSDELDIALEGPRAMSPGTLFCAPCSWSVGASHLHFFNDFMPDYRAFNQVIWFIEVERHWVQAEAYLHEDASNFAFTFPANSHIRLQPLVDHLLNVTGARDTQISIHFYDQVSPQHMCGYQLVAHIYQRLAANTVALQPPQRRLLSFHFLAADLDRAHVEARAQWTAAGSNPHLIDFAANIRQWFLVRVAENRFPSDFNSAGANDQDVSMKSAEPSDAAATNRQPSAAPTAQKDPWLKTDPWLKATPRPSQSKWEDLVIKEPVPFTGTDGAAISQTHRLQVGGARGGLVFATKAHVQDIAKAAGSTDLAILLPASDNLALPIFQNKLQGPFEVSLDDVSAKIAYKRLVMLFPVRGTINYKLPEPVAKLTTGAVCEIVLEVDGRLINKGEFDRIKENPIASFKAMLGQVVPKLDNSAVIFGFRVAHHPGGAKQDPLLQCVLKAPHGVRTPLIEASGMTPLLTRDFLDKGRNSEDTTVLPRFWPPNITELSNIRKTVEGTEGLAGLVLTRRGLAPRVWIAQVGKARTQLLADDPRVMPENINVVPKYTFSLAGWPAATGAHHVVTSTLQALNIPVLPLRTYRAAGVHVWIVTTDKKPAVTSFPLQINADVVEILIQEIEHGPSRPGKAGGKGNQKGKGKSLAHETSKPWAAPTVPPISPAVADDARIQRLEERFEKIETRQANFESKVDGKFDSIQDALRQILANTNSRVREPTGETPPSKHSKQC